MADGASAARSAIDPVVGGPMPDEALIARARELRPLLRANAGPSEKQRKLVDETIQAIEGA